MRPMDGVQAKVPQRLVSNVVKVVWDVTPLWHPAPHIGNSQTHQVFQILRLKLLGPSLLHGPLKIVPISCGPCHTLLTKSAIK